ncbi:MAG: calcineurin-like phosphoesterase family protein [Planctomycetales bacterium]|nr:calcineurin-like phosphoesterase family protein [Planctomycetales bacterium]
MQVATVIRSQLSPPERKHTVRGRVFVDENSNETFDAGETMIAGVRVSNGRDIVKTDVEGRYQIRVDDDDIVFVIKPAGYRTRISEHQLPEFYYIHKPAGSPESKFPGVSPTGDLPESVDFPLYVQKEPQQFKAIFFGDPQPRNQTEVDYITHDVIEELIGTDASFGVTLGDIAYDDLSVLEPEAKAIAVLGIPWYNVIGNHDMNYDAKHDDHSDETFERIFGPSYYSFDYGAVHFLVLDDVEWLIDEKDEGRYQGGLGAEQVQFIRNDLSLIPDDQLVVLMMHIPLNHVRDRHDLYRLIEQRPFCMSVSAHLHRHQHRFITKEDGWRGPEPHHHVVNVTVSGSWWSGLKDERGIPHATMSDGAPNGYSIVEFDGHKYQFNFRAAGRPADYQIQVFAPEEVEATATVEFFANVFNGSEQTEVQFAIGDGGDWIAMERTLAEDPTYKRLFDLENTIRQAMEQAKLELPKDWVAMSKPSESTHLWKAQLQTGLKPGVHQIRVKATNRNGKEVTGQRLIRVR